MSQNESDFDSKSKSESGNDSRPVDDSGSTTGPNGSEPGEQQTPAEEVDIEALEMVRTESREVLGEQISLLGDIDDKAMRTVRTAVLFIGLVISAIQISGDSITTEEIGTWPFRLTTSGVVFLLASIVAGIWTYSVSDPSFGVSSDHRKDVVAGGYTEREWLLFQLNEYDEWTESVRETNQTNVVGLHTTLFSLVAGVLCLLLSAVLTLDGSPSDFLYPTLFTTLFVLGIAAVLWVTRRKG
jgi:hypothetical protein